MAAECKLPLAHAHVLSIASRVDAKSLLALWRIRKPTSSLRQSEFHVPAAPITTRNVSSRRSGQKRILFTQPRGTPEHARLTKHHAQGCTICNTSFCPHFVFGQRAINLKNINSWGAPIIRRFFTIDPVTAMPQNVLLSNLSSCTFRNLPKINTLRKIG